MMGTEDRLYEQKYNLFRTLIIDKKVPSEIMVSELGKYRKSVCNEGGFTEEERKDMLKTIDSIIEDIENENHKK